MNQQNTTIVQYQGAQIVPQSTTLPDVRTLINDEQKKEARRKALAVQLGDDQQIMGFVQVTGMEAVSKRLLGEVKVGDLRGSPVEQLLIELGSIKEQADPMQLVQKQSVKGALKALSTSWTSFGNMTTAYIQNWEKLQTVLEDMKKKLARNVQEQQTKIATLKDLRGDAYNLYDTYTAMEASGKYLLQRMFTEYDNRKGALKAGDLRAAQELDDFAFMIGLLDRQLFELHFNRARAIEVGQKVSIIRRADMELYMMFQNELNLNFPFFCTDMALFVSSLQSEKALEYLKKHRDRQESQAAQLHQATQRLVLSVAATSEDVGTKVENMVKRYGDLTQTLTKAVETHQRGKIAREAGEKQLNTLMATMTHTMRTFDPRKELQAPADVDASLTMKKPEELFAE